jgi:5-methylcytosine-specific restriction endonuclease McrA
MNTWSCIAHLSDEQLLRDVHTLATRERQATADLIAALMEVDARRLYLGEGCSSLFTWCTQVLHFSEHAAYGRIEAARAARRFPLILEQLAEGTVTLTTACLLAPLLTEENHRQLLEEARHKSKRDVELIVARLRPQPAVPPLVRKLPAPKAPASIGTVMTSMREPAPVGTQPAPLPRAAVVKPLAPEVYKIQFTMSREMHDRLRQAQDLLRHAIPNGDLAAVFDRALGLLLDDLYKSKCAEARRPRPARCTTTKSRHVPAAIRREVWKRDGGQCAFVGEQGRCAERGLLEYHHVLPFAAGGETTADNLQLRCRGHNQHEAELYFGPLLARETRATYSVDARSGPS